MLISTNLFSTLELLLEMKEHFKTYKKLDLVIYPPLPSQ